MRWNYPKKMVALFYPPDRCLSRRKLCMHGINLIVGTDHNPSQLEEKMSHPKEWDEDEDNFDLTLSQRTEELYRIPNREPDEDGIVEAAVLPLRDLVIFPRMVSPIFVGREGSLLAVQEAQLKEQTVIGLTQHDPDLDNP